MATRNRMSGESSLLPPALFKFDHLERRVQEHLKKVYSTLAVSMISATAGAYVHVAMRLMTGGLLTTLAALGMMAWLAFTHHSKETEGKRFGIFVGFAFFMGISLGPLLDMVIQIDPSIVMTALLGTSLIFVSFSLAALFNTNRTFLYMGGFLMSAMSWLVFAGFMNIFFRSQLLFDVNLYGGLLVFCAFVLYDTQLIVEKVRNGDNDYIWQSVDLFLDFIAIFRRLMIILANKEEKKKRRD